jgi:hypothetical protein
MHGTRIERGIEICATNLAKRTKCMRTRAKKWEGKMVKTHICGRYYVFATTEPSA